ncbi:hypothetical protein SAMN05660841_04013 [Sphingobacterium nematocida]|uniref:Uncharacterized protein n=1 Tax=Sphingobacterium nematocida TaxID=1513896 RepID=A0A1T5GFE5_9SPHI|nr:hypothetical protein [Sphingobacterium nematocida]SKC07092.1 hypothetical protein SAMN05660841_04013 [Sphingobacterium nematocida]
MNREDYKTVAQYQLPHSIMRSSIFEKTRAIGVSRAKLEEEKLLSDIA